MSESNCGQALRCANLEWREQQPFAVDFNDIYHADDGVAETQRVFIEPADLARRWQRQADFCIAELGFGTGLNLVALLEHWRRAPGTRLHYLSFEQHPLSLADWSKLCRYRQAEHREYVQLNSLYPPAVSGWHQRSLDNGRITLSLYWGDAARGLADLQDRLAMPVDAWWLDGFAPDRNPALWQPALFKQLARLSAAGTSVTTFTAAGRVRRALADAGFDMRRVDQRPHKRESLAGTLTAPPTHSRLCQDPARAESRYLAQRLPVQVVGAGIAGAAIARALADAGCEVQVFDAGHGPLGASTLPAAVLHSRLLSDRSPSAALRLHNQLFASARLYDWPGWRPKGVLQCAADATQGQKLAQLAEQYADTGGWCRLLSVKETRERTAGWVEPLQGTGLWFPECDALRPSALISWLLDHEGIRTYWQQPITDATGWDGIRIYASGTGIFSVAAARYLELSALGGQLELVSAKAPSSPLVGAGYRVPIPDGEPGRMLLGGNYEYRPWSPARASHHNLAQIPVPLRWLGRSRAVRVTSSDRVPVVGALVDQNGQAIANRFVSVAHGSLGMTSAHLSAALITSQLTGRAPPVSTELESVTSPSRFRLRQARRGYRLGASG